MTASTSDPKGWLLFVGLAVVGCRAGLPAEPPGEDAADPDAEATAYSPPASPYETSAFEGVELKNGGGHASHRGDPKVPNEGRAPEPAREPEPEADHAEPEDER